MLSDQTEEANELETGNPSLFIPSAISSMFLVKCKKEGRIKGGQLIGVNCGATGKPLVGWKVVGGAKPRPLDDLLTFPAPATKKRCGPRSATQNRNTVLTISHEYSSMPIRNQKGD